MPVDPGKVIRKRGPKCPKCKSPMVLRTNRHDKSQFWGCSQYPTCQGTYSAAAAQRVMDREEQEALQIVLEEAANNASAEAPQTKGRADEEDELLVLMRQRKNESPW